MIYIQTLHLLMKSGIKIKYFHSIMFDLLHRMASIDSVFNNQKIYQQVRRLDDLTKQYQT
jgi:hypothetical protein